MKSLEEKIKSEYCRLVAKTGYYPSFLHVHPKFVEYLVNENVYYGFNRYGDFLKYMGMDIKRSLDIKENEFVLSFSKYDL